MAKLKNLTLSAGIAVAAIVLPSSLYAGTESKAVVETPAKSALSGDLGVNFVSEYITHGVMQENQGVIAQPYADLYYALYEGDGAVNKVSLNLGVWSSLHSRHPGNESNTPGWYEFDYTIGVAVTFCKDFTLTTSYLEFDSPSSSFDLSRNLNFNLAYDDTSLLGAFALHPHVAYLRELGYGAAGTGNGQGNYYEIGIAPVIPTGCCVTLTVPVTAGFGSNRFYAQNKTFGYASAGLNAAVPIACIPAKYGTWTFNAGATYVYLADQNADYSGVDNNRFVFNGGVGVAF
jgi:hypothetical protein